MTNAELLAKIKAEIEKQIKDPQEHCYGVSSINKLRELLDFLSTLESEKPMNHEGLEEEINRTYHDGSVADTSDMDHVTYENIAEYFYDLGCRHAADLFDEIEYNRQRAEEESVPKDIEEAAENYEQTRNDLEAISDNEIVRRAFIAGAKWQAEQLLKSSPLPEDTVLFNKGVEEGRRLMMEEAVEGEVCIPNVWVEHKEGKELVVRAEISKELGFKFGDKVRVNILPKED